MSHKKSTRAFFIFELPDPKHQLFIQLGEDLDTFTLFPKLPIEIRPRIWRDAFPPPRYINLDYEIKYFSTRYRRGISNRKQVKIPPTFHINRESRAETLKHYFTIHGGPSNLPLPPTHRIICLDPNRDHLYINFFNSLFGFLAPRHFHYWISYLVSNFPACVNAIQFLEVRETHWNINFPTCLITEPRTNERSPLFLCCALLLFPSLKRVCFTSWERNSNESFPAAPQLKRKFEDGISALLEKHKDEFLSGQAPIVEVRSYQNLRP